MTVSAFFNGRLWIDHFVCAQNSVRRLSYGLNAKVNWRIIGDFASSLGFGLDVGIQFQSDNAWKFGVMARDITTTFNAWTFNKENLATIENAVEGQNQEVPEATELSIPKLQLGLSKIFIFNYDYALVTALDLNVRFIKNNNVFSSAFASITPSLGFEFDYTDLVFLRRCCR